MRVLFSISGLEYGGTEVFLSRLANELTKEHTIYILNTLPNSADKNLVLSFNKKIRIYTFYKWFNNLCIVKTGLKYRLEKLYLNKLINIKKIELVISFKYHSDALITSTLDKKSIPVIISTRGCYSVLDRALQADSDDYTYFNREVVRIFNRANGLIWLTEENKKILAKHGAVIPPNNIQIYNGYTMPKNGIARCAHPFKETINIGMVARGDEIKGWDELINAYMRFKETTNIVTQLTLVGEGDHLNKLAKQYKHIKDIVFTGFTATPEEYIKDFDIAVLPSRFDTMPNAIIEYLAHEKAIIASNVGEIPRMLDYCGNSAGILIDIENGISSIPALTQALKELVNNTDFRQELQQGAKNAFKKFNMEHCALQYSQFFKNIVNESRSSK